MPLAPGLAPLGSKRRRIDRKQNMNANALTFTTDERAVLADLRAHGLDATTCATDGPEWAALMPTAPADPFSFEDILAPAWSVQLTDEPGRRCVILAGDGRRELAAGDALGPLVAAQLHR